MKAERAVPTTVDGYIAAFPPVVQRSLRRVRGAIRTAVPDADEVISYGMPAYKLAGRAVIYFAGWKKHYSIYPSTAPLVAAFRSELAPYEVNDKGTIRFPLSEPVPVKLIARIARFRANEVAPRVRSRTAVRGDVRARGSASAGRHRPRAR